MQPVSRKEIKGRDPGDVGSGPEGLVGGRLWGATGWEVVVGREDGKGGEESLLQSIDIYMEMNVVSSISMLIHVLLDH